MADRTLYVMDQNEGELVPLKLHDNGDATYSLGIDVSVSDSGASSDATLTNIAASATSVTLAGVNVARLGLSIYNDSVATLYVKLGTTASATSFTLLMQPSSYYEVPFKYTGRVDGLWATASGSARITEFT